MSAAYHTLDSSESRLNYIKDEIRKLSEIPQDDRMDFDSFRALMLTYIPNRHIECFNDLLYYYMYHVDTGAIKTSVYCRVLDRLFLMSGLHGALNMVDLLNDPNIEVRILTLLTADILSSVILKLNISVPENFYIDGVFDQKVALKLYNSIASYSKIMEMVGQIEKDMRLEELVDEYDRITGEAFIFYSTISIGDLYETNKIFRTRYSRIRNNIVQFLRNQAFTNTRDIDYNLERRGVWKTGHEGLFSDKMREFKDERNLIVRNIRPKKKHKKKKKLHRQYSVPEFGDETLRNDFI